MRFLKWLLPVMLLCASCGMLFISKQAEEKIALAESLLPDPSNTYDVNDSVVQLPKRKILDTENHENDTSGNAEGTGSDTDASDGEGIQEVSVGKAVFQISDTYKNGEFSTSGFSDFVSDGVLYQKERGAVVFAVKESVVKMPTGVLEIIASMMVNQSEYRAAGQAEQEYDGNKWDILQYVSNDESTVTYLAACWQGKELYVCMLHKPYKADCELELYSVLSSMKIDG